MKDTGNGFILSTGKEIIANNSIIGIHKYGNEFSITEGYDGGMEELTRDESIELAEYMITQWQEYLASLKDTPIV